MNGRDDRLSGAALVNEDRRTNLQVCTADWTGANESSVILDVRAEKLDHKICECLKSRDTHIFACLARPLKYLPPGVVEKILPPGVSP